MAESGGMMMNDRSQPNGGMEAPMNHKAHRPPKTSVDCRAWNRTKRFSCSVRRKPTPVIQPSA